MFSRRGSTILSCPQAAVSGTVEGVRGIQRRGSQRQPGMAFPCPPSLDTLLSRHWKDLQDGFCDTDELNKILEFQSEELQWTAKKREDLCSTMHLNESHGQLEGEVFKEVPSAPGGQDHRTVQLYWATMNGDSQGLKRLLKKNYVDVDVLYEIKCDELHWRSNSVATFGSSGLWSLEYKRELTSPLRIAAAQGYTECLRYLLENGAQPDLLAGGKAALHEACENGNSDCTELLLEHGASPGLLTEDGLSPLHLCRTAQTLRCAKALVRYGAKVDQAGEEDEETPLHVAARHGLLHHAQLYLRYSADVNQPSGSGETPLGTVCGSARSPELPEGHLQLCRLLLAHGAETSRADEERRTPLHKAARNVQLGLVQLLLEHGADINAIDYNGATALSCALQSATIRAQQRPHWVVRTLLNHGSIKVWPLALLKVLATCAAAPKTVEILFNSYSQVPVTYKWKQSIPEEIYQVHQPFYQSLFDLEYRPRCLQHLCRAAIRQHYGKDCHLLVPQLPIPSLIQRYLLLEPEGFIY